MLEGFRRKRRNRDVVNALWDQIVERARRPERFTQDGLPDTVLGRFESLGLEVFLFLRRCGRDPLLSDLAQDLVDRFMTDLDHSMRELGIGYLAVPKRMRLLAGRFYARVAALEPPVAAGHAQAVAAALQESVYHDAPGGNPDAAEALAHHILRDAVWYESVSSDAIRTGRLVTSDGNDTP